MRRVGLPLSCMTLALAACNVLTGASDLDTCETCGADGTSPITTTDSSVEAAAADGKADVRDASDSSPIVDATETGADADAAPGCKGALDCERVVFVTKSSYQGNLGGIAGADAKCQAAADGSTVARIKGRSFQAWLSTMTMTVSARFPHGTMPYVRTDGQQIATSWTTLTDGSLDNGINVDELGGTQTGNTWTGTASNGAGFAGLACLDWSTASNAVPGEQGNVGGNGDGWSSGGLDGCNATHKLYCFER